MENEKFDFTSLGVNDWNTFFNAQDESYRNSVILEIRTDLRGWIPRTFNLEQDQVDWLDELDEDFIFLISSQLATTLHFRLPVRLVKPDKPNGGITVLGVKRGESHNPISGRATAAERPEIMGEFVFTISY